MVERPKVVLVKVIPPVVVLKGAQYLKGIPRWKSLAFVSCFSMDLHTRHEQPCRSSCPCKPADWGVRDSSGSPPGVKPFNLTQPQDS